jgi:hypothetical protein
MTALSFNMNSAGEDFRIIIKHLRSIIYIYFIYFVEENYFDFISNSFNIKILVFLSILRNFN